MKAKTLSQKLDHFEADTIWFDQHYDKLKEQYPDQFVAVYGKIVVDHGKNLDILMKRLRKKYGKETGDIVVEFIPTEEEILVV
ncbi:MAG: DUF5678 domain-containing protein [bacterium]